MEGCTVSGNSGPVVIFLSDAATSVLNLTDCIFNNNTAKNDNYSIITVLSKATLNLTNSKFNNNEAKLAAIGSNGTVNANGLEVIDNIGRAGIYLDTSAKFSMQGKIIVRNNKTTLDTLCNINFDGSSTLLTVTGKLFGGSAIGINRSIMGVFTKGYGLYHSEDPAGFFTSDLSEMELTSVGTGDDFEAALLSHDPNDAWVYAVTMSLSHNGDPYVCDLEYGDMVATNGSFGTVTNCYTNGALYVPKGANVILELHGNRVDRGLTSARANGYVIYVDGELTIRDSSATNADGTGGTGVITGGYNYSGRVSAGINIYGSGKCTLESGNISGNKAYYSSSSNYGGPGGVRVDGINAMFVMTGGAITENVSASQVDYGSALVCYYGTTIITGGLVSGNSGGVAAIYSYGDGNNRVEISNLTIENNEATSSYQGYGAGGIAARQGSLKLNNVIIRNNSSKLVAGLAIYSGVTCTAENVQILGNTGKTNGGIYNAGNLTLNNVTVSENISDEYSGSIYSAGGTLTMTDCTISGNTSNESGGILLTGGSAALTNVDITDNEGNVYGGLAYGASVLSFSMTGGSITGNKATDYNHNSGIGNGGIYIDNTRNFVFEGVTISNNTGTISGGVNLHNSVRSVATFKGCTFSGNEASGSTSGGGIYQYANTTLTLEDCEVSGNSSSGTTSAGGIYSLGVLNVVGGVTVKNNRGAQAGGIYTKSQLELLSGEISGNEATAAVSSGGVYWTTGSLTVGGSMQIKANKAPLAGGVYVNVGCVLRVAGRAYIQENLNGSNKASNVYFANDEMKIEIAGRMSEGAAIGVTRTAISLITTGYGARNDIEPTQYFTADSPLSKVVTRGTGPDMEAAIMSFDNEINWSYAVQTSLAEHGATKTVTLYQDWEARPDETYTTSFGNTTGYLNGGLYVPVGASIILDLKGYSVDRNLENARSNGYVFYIAGEFKIIDSGALEDNGDLPEGITPSTREHGVICGGNNNSNNSGGAIVVIKDGKISITNADITGNKATGNNSAGGIYGEAGSTIGMNGVNVRENTGTVAGGVYSNNEVSIHGGEISHNTSTAITGRGGVYVGLEGELSISGAIKVTDNANSVAVANPVSNLYMLGDAPKMQVTGSLAGASIGLSSTPIGVLTEGYGKDAEGTYENIAHPNTIFKMDNSVYFIEEEEVNGIREAVIGCRDGSLNWSYAVKSSLADNGNPKTVYMYDDWIAPENETYTTSFGEDVGYSNGRLYVPVGASIVLDLAGRTVSRNLIDRMTTNGSVLYVAGSLRIIDSVGGGKITGGNSNGTGGIYVSNGGTLVLEGGSITGNKSSSTANAGGVNVAGTFKMSGGSVEDNYSAGPGGGVYVESTGVLDLCGEIGISGNKSDGDNPGNVYIASETGVVTVSRPISVTEPIGITRNSLGPVTSGFGANMGSVDESKYFVSENPKYYVGTVGAGGSREVTMLTDDNALNWSYAVKMSLAQNGAQWTVKLTGDWNADPDNVYYSKSFGPDSLPGYSNGALYVPEGANIVLDLNGFTGDRGLKKDGVLTSARTNGYVIHVGGKFRLEDNSTAGTGIVTGGWNQTASRAGGVYIAVGGEFTQAGGNITENESTGTSSAGGVYVGGTYTMIGGSVTNNIGAYGGVYVPANSEINLGGSIEINGNKKADDSASNVFMVSNTGLINIVSTLNNQELIGVTRSGLGAFTYQYGPDNNPATVNPNTKFVSEDPIYGVDGDTVRGYYEGVMTTEDNSMNWDYAVLTSLKNNGLQQTFTMHSDWTAESNRSYATAFGTAKDCYINGGLYVPKGADIILDLNSYVLDRALTGVRSNGYVIYVEGVLRITDLTDEHSGRITGGRNNSGGASVVVGPGGRVIFENGTMTGNTGSTSGAVHVRGSFTMGGGTITGNTGTNAGGVYVAADGEFEMTGGHITDNRATHGGGVYIAGGRMSMVRGTEDSETSGVISDNNGLAGGVYVAAGSVFDMSWGTIRNNNGTSVGGVYVVNSATAQMIMSGGVISENTGISSGGVYDAGTFEMSGGVIRGNIASGTSKTTGGGSGVYIPATGTFTMTGGEITGNIGMNGVRAYSSAILNMGGTAKVNGNETNTGEPCNVYITIPSRLINIVSEFVREEAAIYVTRDNAGVFTNGYWEHNTILPMMVFISDDTKTAVSVTYVDNGDGPKMEGSMGIPVSKPVVQSSPTYNGAEQVVISEYAPEYMMYGPLPAGVNLRGTDFTAINAGMYTVTFYLREGYCWNDGSNSEYVLNIEILPIVVSVNWSGDSFVYDGK